jgi:uncharacterized cupin superfamily protein
MRHLRHEGGPTAGIWPKGLAIGDRLIYDLATRPSLLSLLKPLLGDDIVLWAASIQARVPGQAHPWHTDIETSNPDLEFVSVWIGIENTSRDSALTLVSRTHHLRKPIQQVVHERGLRRGEATPDMVLEWARREDPKTRLIQPEMVDGQGIIFDGRIWHGTYNAQPTLSRTALLLQYTSASTPLQMPDFSQLEWPFRFLPEGIPAIRISGSAGQGWIVEPPPGPAEGWIGTKIIDLALPLEPDQATGWRPFPLISGQTPNVESLEAHVSVLSPGHSPHPPHAHIEEEVLIVLDGEGEVVIADGPNPDGARVERLLAGSFIYYPAYQYHTIRNVSQRPATYMMFKWRGAPFEVSEPLGTIIAREHLSLEARGAAFQATPLLDNPTSFLSKLHAHLTVLQPGAAYEEHADEHDVAIIVLSGKVETGGQILGPYALAFFSAGELHGMRNVGPQQARYLVLEFHGPAPLLATALRELELSRAQSALKQVTEERDQAHKEVVLLQERINQLLTSSSWRLTAPMRRARELIRRRRTP